MSADTHANRLSGGELVARTLKKAGVKKVFALHGGHHEALFKGCLDNDIELIDFRHEAAAGHAADAYARTTGELGVCIVTAGPGFANAMPSITNAQLDGSPVLFLIGAPPLREVETNPLQGGIDQIAMARPTTKWALSVPATERIPDLTAMAIRKAVTGRPGAVVLELPIDILHMDVPETRATEATGVSVHPSPAPSPHETAKLADMIAQAERPVLVAGMEAANAQTARALQNLLAGLPLKLPVVTKTQATGLLPASHPCNAGGTSTLGLLPVLGLETPDLVILLGAKMGLLLGGRSGALVPHDALVTQICSDAGEIGRIRNMDLAIAADTDETLKALKAELLDRSLPDLSQWCESVTGAKNVFAANAGEPETDAGIHPFHAARAIAEIAGEKALYALDGGEAASWAGAAVNVDSPGHMLSHGYLGCLGIGPGFAIGCQSAFPDRRVVHFTGDGAFGFHLQELDTMVRHNLPIVTVVLNNQVWGMSIHGQQIMYGPNYNVISKLGGTNYASIATAFGCHGERVSRLDEIGPAMRRALDSGKPALLEVMTDPDIVHPVTVSMLGQVEEGSRDVMIPYYENIPMEG